MATVTFIKYDRQSPSALSRVSEYIQQEHKTAEENGAQPVSGLNCSPQFAAQEFMATRQAHRKDSPVFFYHYVQSFHPGEPVTGKLAHKVAREFAARAWPESDVLIATHIDAEHIHSHFLVNAVCQESGMMLRQGPGTLARLRPISDEICVAHGLSILPRQQRSETHGVAGREYRSAAKGESWKFRLMNTIDECMRYAKTKSEYVALMESEGYAVRWEDTRRSITYTTPRGLKCRDDRLHDTKYLKEAMELEFRLRAEIISGRIEAAQPAAAEHTAGAGSADAGAGSADAGAAPDPAGVEHVGAYTGQAGTAHVGAVGGAVGADEQAESVPDGGADNGAGAGCGGGEGELRTGWEEARAAVFAPAPAPAAHQAQSRAAAHTADAAGALGALAQLVDALGNVPHAPPLSDATTMGTHIDRKRLRALRNMKIAAGHRPDDHEDEEAKHLNIRMEM